MKPGPLDLKALDKPYVCVIQLATQPKGVIHQVTLRPDKVKSTGKRATDAVIRLGETPQDEANGWVSPAHIHVLVVLGTAKEVEGKWQAEPIHHVTAEEAYRMVQ